MGGQRSSKWLWWVLVAIVILGAGLWRLRQRPTPTPTVTEAAFGCPEHTLEVRAYDSIVSSIPIAPTTGTIPEYHDCQRFVVGKEFGPLVAIWAAESVANYFPALKPGESDRVAYAVAEILDFGNGPTSSSTMPENYPQLHIERGFNCLYLWRGAAPDHFEARIVYQPKRADLDGCVGTRELDRRLTAAPPLSVRATLFSPDDSLPRVARWDWDSSRGVQYISIWCGTAWCEVGPGDGFTPSVAADADPALNAALDAAREPAPDFAAEPAKWKAMKTVKGWYDQQRLEVWDGTGHLVPSDIVGTIVPHPVLGAIMKAAPTGGGPSFEKRWTPAAYIHVPKPYSLKTFRLGAGVSLLYLCLGTSAQCPGAAAASTASGTLWFSKLVSPGLEPQYRTVKYEGHGGQTIPAAAARWRWLETDGTTWVRCGSGCCTDN